MPTLHDFNTVIQHAVAATIFTLIASAAGAAPTPEETRKDIRSTYNFDPKKMTFDEQAATAPSLSQLWDRYAKNPEIYGPALRAELRAEGNTEQLYCDGGMLLLFKGAAQDDQALGLASLRHCSLAEIQHTPYFYTVHRLALKGVDTFDLQARMLTVPTYSVFIVQHALRLGQDYAFLYAFLLQDEHLYTPRLVARLNKEADGTAQKSLVRALWYAATPESAAALHAFVQSPKAVEPGLSDARKLLKEMQTARALKSNDKVLTGLCEATNICEGPSEVELRAKRKAVMRRVSDEALQEMDLYTMLIYRANDPARRATTNGR